MCKFRYKGKKYDVSVTNETKGNRIHGAGFIYNGLERIIFTSDLTAVERSKYFHRIIKRKGLITGGKHLYAF